MERYAVDVSGGLAARGHEVLVLGGERAAMRDRLPAEVRWAPGATPRQALTSLRAAGRVDVVHSHITKADFAALAAAPWSRAARFSTRHINHSRGYSGPARLVARGVRRALAAEIAVSEFTAGRLPEGRPDEVLVNGVADAPEPRYPRERTVLVAQRLSAEKQTSVAIAGFARSGVADAGWRLQIAGRGEEQPALQHLATELGVSAHVEFLGWVDDVAGLYARAGLLLAPAPAEPLGLTVLEAAARALPVLAAASGGHLETVGRLPGAELFAPGDAAAVADALRRLTSDDGRRLEYGRRLRQLQRSEFTLDEHVRRLEALYVRAVGPGR
nr:glycosyltransferase family 4 protein [Kineococcus siccus]